MPDSILFKGEFDNSDIIKGLDGMLDAVKRQREENERLKASITESTKKMEDQSIQILKLKYQLEGVTGDTKDYSEENKKLLSTLESLKKQYQDLSSTVELQKKQLETASASMAKMTEAYEAARKSVEDLQNTSGKPIAPTINDGDLVRKIADIKAGVTGMVGVVSAKVLEARKRLSDLLVSQANYTSEIKSTSAAIKDNEKKLIALNKQLAILTEYNQGGTRETAKLREEIRGLNSETSNLKKQLGGAQINLAGTTSAIKAQNTVVKEAEKAGKGLTKSLGGVYTGLRKITRWIPGLSIGVLVGLISGPLIDAFSKWIRFMDEAGRKQKILSDIYNDAGKIYSSNAGKILILKDKLNDLSISEKERIDIGKEYNKIADKANQLDLTQINNLDEINPKIEEQIQLYKERAIARAAENVISQKAEVLFKAQMDLEARFPTLNKRAMSELNRQANEAVADAKMRFGSLVTEKVNVKELLSFADLPESELRSLAEKNDRFKLLLDDRTRSILSSVNRQLKAADEYKKGIKAGGAGASIAQAAINFAQEDLDRALEVASQLVTTRGLMTEDKDEKARKKAKAAANRRETANIYERELLKLKADIAKINEKGFTDEASITAAIEADFKKRDAAYVTAFRNKELTAGQLASLQGYLKDLQALTLKKGLEDFAAQKAEYLRKINDQIQAVQNEVDLKRISLIEDGFERERQIILAETDKTVTVLSQKRDKTIADLLKNAAKNGLTEKDLQPQINSIKNAYSSLLDSLDVLKNQKLQKLSFDTFQKLADDAKKSFDRADLNISRSGLIDIQKQTELYQAGNLSYEKYQKELTRIAKEESDARYFKEVENLRKQIRLRENQLVVNSANLTNAQRDQLEKEVQELQKKLIAAEQGQIKGDKDKPVDDPRIQRLLDYVNAVQSVVDSVISLWQAANDAEQKSLERSIAIQDRRVDAARKIAERGNAEYLRIEEERQQELLIKQENAARRTMAINAALQSSQILVALISGIASGAKEGGALGSVIQVAAIIAAIAGAFAIAQSFKQPQPSFFVGTEDTGKGGNVDSKGGFHAILHPNERVVSAEENKHLRGISNRDLIRKVTENYNVRPAAALNLTAMENAVNSSTRSEVMKMDGIERELKLNNHLQLKTHKLLKGMGVSFNWDERGASLSILKTLDEIEKSKFV